MSIMNQDHFTVILEDISSKFDHILEVVIPLTPLPARLERLEKRFDELASDMVIVKEVSKETNHDIAVLKSDVAVLKDDVTTLKSDVARLDKNVAILSKESQQHSLQFTKLKRAFSK